MAFLGQEYVVSDLPVGTGFDPIPAGWYTAKVVEAKLKDTKSGTGQYIAIRYDILGPQYQGRVVFGNINIKNPNPQAEEIGRQQLGDLSRSIGLSRVSDTDQLIGGEVQIKVSVRKQEGYDDSNDVRGFKAVDGTTFVSQAPAAQPKTQPPVTKGATPPWAKR